MGSRTRRAQAAALRRGAAAWRDLPSETGDTDSQGYRLFGEGYPYCVLVEHVGSFNGHSLSVAGARAGLTVVHMDAPRIPAYLYSTVPWGSPTTLPTSAYASPGGWVCR